MACLIFSSGCLITVIERCTKIVSDNVTIFKYWWYERQLVFPQRTIQNWPVFLLFPWRRALITFPLIFVITFFCTRYEITVSTFFHFKVVYNQGQTYFYHFIFFALEFLFYLISHPQSIFVTTVNNSKRAEICEDIFNNISDSTWLLIFLCCVALTKLTEKRQRLMFVMSALL